jgi:transcriptional regulator GlxA family with amidase domain
MQAAVSNCSEPKSYRPGGQHYRRIVDRIEVIARETADKPLRVGDLCEAVGVSPRTLRNAFQVVCGAPPYRYLRALRLREARKVLLAPGDAAQTVTQIAVRFGFLELGRFSVEYRQAFGERPSATLRRSITARNRL